MTEASKGLRPNNIYIVDELDFLKNYTPDQLKELWESVMPKSRRARGVVITGTK